MMMKKKLKLQAPFEPTGDQPQAIEKLVKGVGAGLEHQVLLGVTGSGKTFSIAKVIEKIQKPTLVISHNKTLAAQLYQEFRDFFPENAVSYFVSYYDYYQPEAYIPQTDTYIEKEVDINEQIDKLRLAATTNLLTRPDTIVVASVSCIYNLGSPVEYGRFILELARGMKVDRQAILKRLTDLQYERSDAGFHRSTFRVRGETVDIFPAYQDEAVRLEHDGARLTKMASVDPLTGEQVEELNSTVIYPAKHYMTDPRDNQKVFEVIKRDLAIRVKELQAKGKILEAHRLEQKVNYDLEMIAEVGYVNGIENYSRYFDGRKPGEAPYTLLDYFKQGLNQESRIKNNGENKSNFLVVIDESHMTVPQIRGMYNGDRSRKETLIDYGFRLPAAIDNRPLRFDEFLARVPQVIYTSATPNVWEVEQAQRAAKKIRASTRSASSAQASISREFKGVVEQLLRPTGLVDPEIIIRPAKEQVRDLISEIEKRAKKKQRVLVTTLTKRMAEDLAEFLEEKGVKVHYLHSDVDTLERLDILEDLRRGVHEVIVGVNLLREGLDLPEVSLVAILDADKEGFLRSETSLIQTMGRAARNVQGQVILYADKVTGSMGRAIKEVERRRNYQLEYNRKHGITPKTIEKPIRERIIEKEVEEEVDVIERLRKSRVVADKSQAAKLLSTNPESLTPEDKKKLIKLLRKYMREAAKELNFELAAELRDKAGELMGG
jgi:excinuclease ABC subunit B